MEFRTKTIKIQMPVVRYRKVSLSRAKKEIEHYIVHRKKKAWIEEITDDLRIEPLTAIRALESLEKEGRIKEAK